MRPRRRGRQVASRPPTRFLPAVAAGAIATVVATACGAGGGGGGSSPFAGHNITWIIPADAGGGFDQTSRQLQPYVAKALGTNVAVQDKGGGQFAIGAQATLNAGNDCTSIMTHADPHLLLSYLAQKGIGYTYSDFYPIMSLTNEPAVIRVQKDAKWKSLKDLVADAKAHPKTIKMSVSGLTNNNYLSVYQLEQATGAKFNIVSFDGGGPAREALVAGQVDVTDAGVYNSLSVAKSTRVLAVQQDTNKWKDVTDNAPTVNDALGTSLPPNGSVYGAFVTKKCYQQHRDRYDALVKAFKSATQNSQYRAKLKKLGELSSLNLQDAATYDKQLKADEKYLRDLIKKNPTVFTQS